MKNKHKKNSLYKEKIIYSHEKLKNKAYNTILNVKQLKFHDFIEDFVEIDYNAFLEIDKSKCKTKSVTTDLKEEYRKPIDTLIRDHQFCQFHLQQKKRINSIIYAQNIKNAIKMLEDILNNKKNYYKPIIEI